ncbi:hypothetical protein [Lysobacter sp. N42]|uniref:hypothetical protein n=1 Tax=Lysobacter sp. N42 TaxID=2545719 RepID=UPI00104DCCAE|nr:hypothetical protein [Lysobacter sp. N42]TCZ86595.1 hypothetical protein EYQ95_17750 [Lysobacter sp. N42]
MSRRRRHVSVFLTEPGRLELATLLTPWLRVGAPYGAYVECRKVHLEGDYAELVLGLESEEEHSVDVRLNVPHHFVAAVLEVSDEDAFTALYSG